MKPFQSSATNVTQTGHPPWQLAQPIHALCCTPDLRVALGQDHAMAQVGQHQEPARPRSHRAAPAPSGEAILSAGHRPALHDDSRDGTPSQSVTGQEMLPQLPADVSL